MNVGLNIFNQCQATKRKHHLFVVQTLNVDNRWVEFQCRNCTIEYRIFRFHLRRMLTKQ